MVIRFVGVLIASLMILSATANAVQMVVVNSTAPSIVPGIVINEGEELNIPAGNMVKLVSESGEIIRLKGPFAGVPKVGSQTMNHKFSKDLIAYLKAMFANRELDASVIAAVRANRSPIAPNLWWLNISLSGKHCFPTEKPIFIWRSGVKKRTELLIKKSGGTATKSLWSAGTPTTAWPNSMPLENGVWYSLITSHPRKSNMVQLQLLPRDLPTDAHRAVWMAKNGCKRQAMRLLEVM
jgi:hypothetical protein